jgi:AraC-like DNA-binding protein
MEATRIIMYKRKMNKPANSMRVNFSNWQLRPPPGAVWGPRTLPDTELICIHSGVMELETKKNAIRASTGDLLIIRPGEKHILRNTENPCTISCIHCDLPAEELQTQAQLRAVLDEEIPKGFQRCAVAFHRPSEWREKLLQSICSELWIRIQAEGSARAEMSSPDERINSIARHLQEHCDEPFDRRKLAQLFHISPQHLNYLFRTQLHTTPTEMLHRERVKYAFLLMQNEHLSVKEAAERTGFYDTYHFSKVFKKAYGFPPSRVNDFFKPQ